MGRQNIIDSLKQHDGRVLPLPASPNSKLPGFSKVWGKSFIVISKQIGAEVIEVKAIDDMNGFIIDSYPDIVDFSNKAIWKNYPANCTKKKLDKLNTVLLEGQFGVAENGAIWVDEKNFPNRLIPFVAQQVIIKLSSKKFLKNMEEAYRVINLTDTAFGVFISGPSKTADIEQCLVYGAHGPKKLTIIIYS
jgi:L-lactate dehydrogenase complex protein LldG